MRVVGHKTLPLALMIVALAGCSMINPKGDDYKRSSQLPPLEIPPQLSKPQADDRNAIPDPKDVASSATYSEYAKSRGLPTLENGYVPGGGMVDPKTAKAHIERNGSDRWLVVNGSPDQVYAFVRNYLVEAGYKLSAEKPDIGVIETDWMEVNFKVDSGLLSNLFGNLLNSDDSASFRDRYTFRIDQGKEKGTVEVYVSHKGLEEVALGLDNFKWQPRPSDPQKEAEMLKSLMVKFGVDADKASKEAGVVPKDKAKKEAQSQPEKSSIITGTLVSAEGGGSAIRIEDSFDRAWRQAGLAIDKAGLVTTDQNRQDGVFYVLYDPSKIKGDDPFNPDNGGSGISGWFSSLWGSSDKKPKSGETSSIAKFEPKSSFKVLVLRKAESISDVMVQDREGHALTPELSKRFLSILLSQKLN